MRAAEPGRRHGRLSLQPSPARNATPRRLYRIPDCKGAGKRRLFNRLEPAMTDQEKMDEQVEDRQMNWFAAGVLALGSPLFVLAFMGHHWAEIACKVYVWTASVFGAILLFIERPSLRQKWLWIGMIPLAILHTAAMYGVVVFNLSYPQIDRLPIATYGTIVPLIGLEVGLLELVLEWFKPVQHKRVQSEDGSPTSD